MSKLSFKLRYEPRHDKTNKVAVHPAKTQISLGIRPVWSESSLCTQWVAKDPSFLHADSKDSDQTGWMPRLIWVFAGRTVTLLVLSCHSSIIYTFCKISLFISFVCSNSLRMGKVLLVPMSTMSRPWLNNSSGSFPSLCSPACIMTHSYAATSLKNRRLPRRRFFCCASCCRGNTSARLGLLCYCWQRLPCIRRRIKWTVRT